LNPSCLSIWSRGCSPNLYLAAEAIKAGACTIGTFSDDAINELLGLDGVKQFVIYLTAVGKRKQSSQNKNGTKARSKAL
jgi:nitroreductase